MRRMHRGTSTQRWNVRPLQNPAARLITVAIVMVLVGSALAVSLLPRDGARGPGTTLSAAAPSFAGAGVPRNDHIDPSASALPTVLSTLDLVDNRTLPGDEQPASQDTPLTIVYDSENGDLYVRGDNGESLTVVNGSTNTAVAEVGLPESQNPDSLLTPLSVDAVGNSVYVANEGPTSNISIINGTTNRVSGSVTVGGSPDAIADDPANGDLYVSNWGLDAVNVVNVTTNTLLKSIPVGSDPYAILYDPAANQVFVANWGSGNTSVINPETNSIVANIATGTYPVALALDTHDDYVDVANSYNGGQGTVTVIPAPVAASTHGTNVSVGHDPDALAYAPKQDQLFVANGGTENVSVLNQSTHLVVGNPAVGVAPAAAAYDPTSHDVYVLNSESPSFNITILNPADDASVGNVPIDNYFAYGLAVDTGNGNVFAVSEGSFLEAGPPPHAQANATVVSGITNHAIASVPLIVYPEGLTFDPYLGDLIVADPGGNDTYLVNTTTSLIGGVRSAALLPERSAFDSRNDEAYVVDDNDSFPYIGEVTILNSQLQEVTNITLGYDPSSIAFDSANGKFYVPDSLSGNVWVLNGTTNKYNTTIAVAASADLVSALYDPHNHEVYVGDSTTSEIIVINGTRDVVVGDLHVGNEPSVLAFDSRNDTVFVGNSGSGNVSVINDTTNSIVETFALADPGAFAYDGADNVLYNAESFAGNVETVNASTYASAGSAISLGSTLYPHGIVYDPENQFVYVSTEYQGSVSIIPSATYAVTFVESGLTGGTPWSVTLAGAENSSSGTTIGFSEPNGNYDFTVGAVAGYTANVTSGSVQVAGSSRTVDIGFTAVASSYAVTFVESGLPGSSQWNVTLNSVQNHSTTDSIGFLEPTGTYPFTVGRFNGFVANVTSGNVTVSSSPVIIDIGFTAAGSAFPVTFVESGLPLSTPWSVTFHGALNSSSTSTIGFLDANGTWPFSVGRVSGYVANVTSGNVTVSGVPVHVAIGFTAAASVFPVNFTETGLPAATPWTVTLAGTVEGSSTPTISFSESDGMYPFTVGTVTGYSASPNSGSVDVSGASVDQAIEFRAGTAQLSVELSAAPTTLTLGGSTTFTATTAGGNPPFSYAYTGLPAGCRSENTSSFGCTPTVTGSFGVNVTVTDAKGDSAKASVTLTVSSPTSSSSGLGSWWIVIVIVVLAAVVLIVLLLRRSRRAPPAPAPSAPASPPGSPPPPP